MHHLAVLLKAVQMEPYQSEVIAQLQFEMRNRFLFLRSFDVCHSREREGAVIAPTWQIQTLRRRWCYSPALLTCLLACDANVGNQRWSAPPLQPSLLMVSGVAQSAICNSIILTLGDQLAVMTVSDAVIQFFKIYVLLLVHFMLYFCLGKQKGDPQYPPCTHMTCVPTRVGLQYYTLDDPYDTWCTCINTETETDHRLFHRNTNRRQPTLKTVTP